MWKIVTFLTCFSGPPVCTGPGTTVVETGNTSVFDTQAECERFLSPEMMIPNRDYSLWSQCEPQGSGK